MYITNTKSAARVCKIYITVMYTIYNDTSSFTALLHNTETHWLFLFLDMEK